MSSHGHNSRLSNYLKYNLRSRPPSRELTSHNNGWTCNYNFINKFEYYLRRIRYSVENISEIDFLNNDGSLTTTVFAQFNTSHCSEKCNTWPIVLFSHYYFTITYYFDYRLKIRFSVNRLERQYRAMKTLEVKLRLKKKCLMHLSVATMKTATLWHLNLYLNFT